MYIRMIIVGIALSISLTWTSKGAGAVNEIETRTEIIAQVLPMEYAEYENQVAGDNGPSDVRALILLASKAKAKMVESAQNTDHGKYDTAYYALWSLGLNMYANTDSLQAKELILNQWDDSLESDDNAVPFQISSLADCWNRDFMSNHFWQLLQNTKRKETISAICYVLYRHGDSEDVKRLTQKRKSGINIVLQAIIQNAINWMNYRLSGDTTNPGPAALGPRPEIEDVMAEHDSTAPKGSGRTNSVPMKLMATIPSSVYQLMQWPGPLVLSGPKHVDPNTLEVTSPEEQSVNWLQKVLDRSWLPDNEAEMISIRDEFNRRDTVRLKWMHGKYQVQVSQTASIVAIKCTPTANMSVGVGFGEKVSCARQLCSQIFKDTGIRYTHDANGSPIEVPVKGLKRKIADYSFNRESVFQLTDSVVGFATTPFEGGIKSETRTAENINAENSEDNANWDSSLSSWSYWWRHVGWYNDGKSIGFFLLKKEADRWNPQYDSKMDESWFEGTEFRPMQ